MNLLDQPLGQIAREIPGATEIFHQHKLDFCCGGHNSLRAAATIKDLDADAIAAQLKALAAAAAPAERDWSGAEPVELIEHILTRYHARHREQLPELIRLARRVELVHRARTDCPAGLADHLEMMEQAMESHMQKEEQVLFPMLAAGHGAMAAGPVSVMRMEHDDHGQSLDRLAELTDDFTLPPDACGTWQALYLGVRTLRQELMDHIHLENNILFEDALAGAAGHA